MEPEKCTYKYKRHSEKQYMLILSTAMTLFMSNGIDKVSLTDIARECGIMRSTFYRYFSNKEEIIWNIVHYQSGLFAQKILDRFEKSGKTTFKRFEAYLNMLYEDYIEDPNQFRFIDLIADEYQSVTSQKNNPLYESLFTEGDFRSGDTVKLIVENFHDGSVRPELDPQTTTVSILYSAWSILTQMYRQTQTLPSKYGVNTEDVVKFGFAALLESIRAY